MRPAARRAHAGPVPGGSRPGAPIFLDAPLPRPGPHAARRGRPGLPRSAERNAPMTHPSTILGRMRAATLLLGVALALGLLPFAARPAAAAGAVFVVDRTGDAPDPNL